MFCSHLQYAGHMKRFVVIRYEVLSKGIRRIVALTGDEAGKVHVLCNKTKHFQTIKNNIVYDCHHMLHLFSLADCYLYSKRF